MRWRYVAAVEPDGYGGELWQVRELYTDGDRCGWTEDAVAASGDSRAELRADLLRMLDGLDDGTVLDLTAGHDDGVVRRPEDSGEPPRGPYLVRGCVGGTEHDWHTIKQGTTFWCPECDAERPARA